MNDGISATEKKEGQNALQKRGIAGPFGAFPGSKQADRESCESVLNSSLDNKTG